MFHALQQLVPMRLQEQAVVIKNTFIERADAPSMSQRRRYYSDSAVIITSCCDAETLSDACSTADEEDCAEGAPKDRFTDSDLSDGDGSPAPQGEPDGEEFAAAEALEGGESWRHMRTASFSDAMQAPRPARAGLQAPRFVAVFVPVMPGQCSTVAAAPAADAATAANPPAPRPVAPARTGAAASAAPTAARAQQRLERRTTVMVRNVPNNYTRKHFLALLDRAGLCGLYDFVYLPVDFQTGAALGYAFVNAVDPSAVQQIWKALDGFSRWTTPSRKRCSVSWNDPHQGFDENVARYRNSPVMHPSVPDSYKPAIFSGGVRVPYPEPTKAVKAPRLPK
mmetsp:Transcript_17046/g.34819  ORF Transcript_17046/g.34819 Transcript_17046/m.34819 type:complete len:338 (-) Transcript_17046:427-1440(-)